MEPCLKGNRVRFKVAHRRHEKKGEKLKNNIARGHLDHHTWTEPWLKGNRVRLKFPDKRHKNEKLKNKHRTTAP